MIGWEEINDAESMDELSEAKTWLLEENLRLEKESARLDEERKELADMKNKIIAERVRFRDEMDTLNHKMVIERKRLKEEHLFFDKKMAILQDGFRSLDEDRKKLEREKLLLEQERIYLDGKKTLSLSDSGVAGVLFRTVNNSLTLKKRYRDLVRIFHPDNLCGDDELIQLINKEFQQRKDEI